MTEPQTIDILGLHVGAISRAEWVEVLSSAIETVRLSGAPPKISSSINGNVLALAAEEPAFRAALARADFIDADGMPIVVASRYFPHTIPERCATTDFYHDMAKAAVERGYSFYLLGGSQEVNDAAIARSLVLHPGLRIAGGRNGYFRPDEEDAVIADIVACRPDFLWVGLGIPLEQMFMARNAHRLQGVGVVKTCGGLFDFVSGRRSRAPQWMQDCCLEWLYRLGLEPRRLFKRYLKTNIQAAWILLRSIYKARKADRIGAIDVASGGRR